MGHTETHALEAFDMARHRIPDVDEQPAHSWLVAAMGWALVIVGGTALGYFAAAIARALT